MSPAYLQQKIKLNISRKMQKFDHPQNLISENFFILSQPWNYSAKSFSLASAAKNVFLLYSCLPNSYLLFLGGKWEKQR